MHFTETKDMICTTIQNKGQEHVLEALEQCEMAEIRLDRCPLSMEDIDVCFSSDVPLVATCRIGEIMEREPSLNVEGITPQSREIKAAQIAEKRLCRAIEAGARYVDVELEAPKHMSKRVRGVAHENGTVFIRSYHDFERTDSFEALKALVEKCRYHGADVVKIVTMAHSQEDVDRVMSLYDWDAQGNGTGRLIAFCMGDAGRESRLECLRRGAPFTYAALDAEEAAAPGQWPAADMAKAVYGDFRFVESCGCASAPGQENEDSAFAALQMPSSKSFAQRAIVAAALAEGVSRLRGYTPCGDNDAAVDVARAIGAEVNMDGNELTIKGIAASLGSVALPELHVGESGLLARMMLPLMTQLSETPVTITGEKTLLERPLTGASEIMEAFGAKVKNASEASGPEQGDNCLKVPFEVTGPLSAGRAEVSGKHGSQLISGLLMSLPFAGRNSSLIVHEPKSIPYMFITLEVLKKFGIKIGNEMLGGRDFLESDGDWSLCTEMVFKIKGGQMYKAADIDLEGDWSAASNFLVAGAIFGKAELQGLDTTSLQADLSIMDILMDAGASLSQLDGEKGNITVQRAPLSAFSVDASNCPDLFPVISVLAAFCQGTSRIAGVGRLANKESDRAGAILEMMSQMGFSAAVEGDELVVHGKPLAQRLMEGSMPKGGYYSSHHDHRMVMALKVAGLGAESPIVIDDEACVSKSFPGFLEMFGRLCNN
jgi:3-phosphoshikimate 1-carboxyvinyltransferase